MVRRALANYKMTTPAGRAALIFVTVLTVVMIALLFRTQANAASIRSKTADIAESGRGINDYTDSIVLLNRTNGLAASIAKAVQPLQSSLASISNSSSQINTGLDSIEGNANSIENSAASINGNAASIRKDVATVAGRVHAINASLTGINSNAASILATAAEIQSGIGLISSNIGRTNTVVRLILGDATSINTRLGSTNHLASCIDNGLNGHAPC